MWFAVEQSDQIRCTGPHAGKSLEGTTYVIETLDPAKNWHVFEETRSHTAEAAWEKATRYIHKFAVELWASRKRCQAILGDVDSEGEVVV